MPLGRGPGKSDVERIEALLVNKGFSKDLYRISVYVRTRGIQHEYIDVLQWKCWLETDRRGIGEDEKVMPSENPPLPLKAIMRSAHALVDKGQGRLTTFDSDTQGGQ